MLKPNFIQKGYRIGLREPVNQTTHLVNRSQGLIRTQCALTLRSLCATAGSQRIIRRAECCNPNKEEKRKKNEQQEELEALTSKLSLIIFNILINFYLSFDRIVAIV